MSHPRVAQGTMAQVPPKQAGSVLCDLHLHSTNSDGLASPEEVIEFARRAGLSVMCISDHSCVTFTDPLRQAAAGHGIAMLPGLEISTTHRGHKYHVLAYGDGVLEASFADFAFRPTAIKNDTYHSVLAELRGEGARLPGDGEIMAGVRDDGPPRHPGKWMLSSTLIARYLAPLTGMEVPTAAAMVKDRYNVLKDRVADRYVPTETTLTLARAAGAIPVIAHPFWECRRGGNTWDGVLSDLRGFTGKGLAGMEVSSRHDSLADEERRTLVARQLGLVPFRSSDFHGNGKTEVGQFPMRAGDLIDAARRCGVDLSAAIQAVTGARKGEQA